MKKFLLFCFILTFSIGLASVQAQDRTVTGKVTSVDDGEALPGVNVVLKGTSTGTVTDIDGNFTLSVPENGGFLTFSFIGLSTQEVEIGARSVIDIQMAADVTQLSEVVVTGYGPQEKRKLTGSISAVEAKSIEQVPIANFSSILQGQAPGLMVSVGNGQPGNTGKVRIRGNSSINSNNDPLYILDGVPIEAGTFATINPNDFESVSVLRDAAAASIYGSRGANGVIVLTSKKGKAGEVRFNYRFQQGFSIRPENLWDLLDTDQKIEWELLTGQGIAPGLTTEQLDSLRGINTNWEDEIFRTGTTQTHEINMSGGNQNSRYYISANYFSQEGIAVDSKLDRYTLRMNMDNTVSEKFRFGNTLSLGFSRENSIAVERGANTNNPFAALSLLNPYDQVRDPETGDFYVTSGIANNVVAIADQLSTIRDETKIIASIYLEYDILKNLTARTNWGIDYRQRDFNNLVPPNSLAGFPGPNNQGSLARNFNRRPTFIGTTSLSYSKTFAEDHNISASIFHEIWYQRFESSNAQGFGLNKIFTPNGTTPGGTTGVASGFIPTFTGTERDESLLSYFANVIYDFRGKYFLNATVRRDGSSRFGENNRFATFWSVGGAWNITEESFFNPSFVDNLKLRASYGTTGNKDAGVNQLTNYYPSRETYNTTVTYDGLAGQVANTPGNPDLVWETNRKANLGFDFSFLNSRLSGTLDLYSETTVDAFITQQLSRTTGFASFDLNAGKIRNRGIEISLSADIVRTADFNLNAFVNLAYNDNEVIDLGQVDEFEQGTSIIQEGKPIGTQYFPTYVGANPANGQPLYLDSLGRVTTTFSTANSVTHGTSEAPHFGGFGLNASFKGLELNVLFSYLYDIELFNNTAWFQANPNFAAANTTTEVLNVWRNPGDVTDFHSINFPTQFSSRFLEDASFLRLRNVTLAYTLPSKYLGNVFNSVRVYAQGQNLLTWTKFTGLDPENTNNLQVFEYPQPRTITFGVDIGF